MILRGAFEVAGREGLDGMSMPGLAAHLNVGVTSIYWYFRNKEDLLRQMYVTASQSLGQLLPSPHDFTPEQWREYLFRRNQQVRAIYAENDLLADLVLHRHAGHSGVRTPATYGAVEAELAYLVEAGFPLMTAWNIYSCLSMFTHGVVINDQARRRSGYPPEGLEQLSMLDVPNVPLLSRLVSEEGVTIDMTGNAFEAGLNMILDWAETTLATENGH